MNYETLKAEIALPAYAGMSDAEIAVALSAQTVATIQDVPTSTARGVLLLTGEFGLIELLAAQVVPLDDPLAPAVAAARNTIATLEHTELLEVATREIAWQSTQAMLAGLVAAGVLASGTRDALLALRDTVTSRAAQIGLPAVQECDVQTARLV